MLKSIFHFKSTLSKILLILVPSLFAALATDANILVLNGLTHETVSQPGGSYRERIEIHNNGTETKDVRMYIRDYWFSYTGESRHDEPGTLKRSNATWVRFNPELLTLAPNEKGYVDFEVNVPQNDSLTGTYWSVIMVEGIETPDTSSSTGGVKINTAIRYAVQIITNIGETGKHDLQFTGMEMIQDGDQKILNIAIENTGEYILKPEVSLEIFDSEGNSAGVFKADRRKTFPGTSIMSSIILVGIKPGNYTAILVADCDEDHIYGTNLSLEI